ncbi:MAG: phosphoribosyl-ATP diphosphatase [Candidatus Alcyoniella australis]|nr:phosphoribosyl-ATP diphosphatase [Candidatus Alcyoniella australis]
MIFPSIDISHGKAVQLVGGERKALEVENTFELAHDFSLYGDLAIIDLDAAKGEGDNTELIEKLLNIAPARVGGGVRDHARYERLIRSGANKVIIGTEARPDFLRELNPQQLVAAVDVRGETVSDQGWRRDTGEGPLERIQRLAPYVSEFLVTHVDREGSMSGLDREFFGRIDEGADRPIVVAGGVANYDDVIWTQRNGFGCQVGMALYTGRISLDQCLIRSLDWDKYHEGLLPTVVRDESGQVLMMAFSTKESLAKALRQRRGIYFSRARQNLWTKGEVSGNEQHLVRVDLDCDADTLLFTVKQRGIACHLGRYTCFNSERRDMIAELYDVVVARMNEAPNGSFTVKLLEDSNLLAEKLREEAEELSRFTDHDNLVWEAADVLYFIIVLLAKEGVPFRRVLAELERRRRA